MGDEESKALQTMLTTTKPCPKCGVRIEKNQGWEGASRVVPAAMLCAKRYLSPTGCQHMKCRQCKYNFCWQCLGKYHCNAGCKAAVNEVNTAL